MVTQGPEAVRPSVVSQFHEEVLRVLERICTTQAESLERGATLIADTVRRDGILYAFGAGHSQSVALEFYYRAGGLAPCDVIEERTFGRAERLPGYAATLLELYPVSSNDLMVIISNSGRNPLPVEMAGEARRRGAPVIGITSLAHSQSVTSRLALGKRLFEVCDVVIDNCGVPGDAAVSLGEDGGGMRVGPVSTLAGAFIAQSLVCRAAEILMARGGPVPVWCSMNLDGGDERNKTLLASVRQRIRGI